MALRFVVMPVERRAGGEGMDQGVGGERIYAIGGRLRGDENDAEIQKTCILVYILISMQAKSREKAKERRQMYVWRGEGKERYSVVVIAQKRRTLRPIRAYPDYLLEGTGVCMPNV